MMSFTVVNAEVFLFCLHDVDGGADNTAAILQCVTHNLRQDSLQRDRDLQSFFFIIAGIMIFFMQTGFAMICAGSVRLKRVETIMLKNLLDVCGSTVAFWLVGYAFAFGGQSTSSNKTFIGTESFLTIGDQSPYWFFEYALSSTSVTIVAGAIAERCQMTAYLWYSMLVSGFVYPVIAHTIWSNNGYLSPTTDDPFLGVGAIDFGGGAVIHMTGGFVALYATVVLGPRQGRFYDTSGEPLEVPKLFQGHSVALHMLGTMILWFGWFGYNSGSALLLNIDNVGAVAANAAVGTVLAGSTAGVSALFTNYFIQERRTGDPAFDLVKCMNGSLAGLVASSSGCVLLEPWAMAIVGIIAGWLYLWSSDLLIRWRIDDCVDAIPVHLFNGAWGMMAVGLFASPTMLEEIYNIDHLAGLVYAVDGFDASLLANQAVAILFILVWTFVLVFPFFVWLNYMNWFQSESLEEMIGLDVSYNGTSATQDKGKESIKKEYLEASQRNKTKQKRRRSRSSADGENTMSDSRGIVYDSSNFDSRFSDLESIHQRR